MRISDWSSDVCSSDLGRWRSGMKCQIARKRRKRSPRLRNWNRAMETRGEPNEQSNRNGCNLAGRMAGGLRVDSEGARQGANRGFSLGQEPERSSLLPRDNKQNRRTEKQRCGKKWIKK